MRTAELMNRFITVIFCIALASCSRRPNLRRVPKTGVCVVTSKDGKAFLSSSDIRSANVVANEDGTQTIWFYVTPGHLSYFDLPVGEPLALQVNGVPVETFATRDLIYTGPPAFPVPDKRRPDGTWLSDSILERVDGVAKP